MDIWRDVKGKETKEKEKAERQGHRQRTPHSCVFESWSQKQLFTAQSRPNTVLSKNMVFTDSKCHLLTSNDKTQPSKHKDSSLNVCMRREEGSEKKQANEQFQHWEERKTGPCPQRICQRDTMFKATGMQERFSRLNTGSAAVTSRLCDLESRDV